VIRILIVLLLLSGCAKDFDLNPWTTVLKQTLKGNNDKTKDSNPSDWLNYLRVGLEFKRD
jgi:hypothetical protein